VKDINRKIIVDMLICNVENLGDIQLKTYKKVEFGSFIVELYHVEYPTTNSTLMQASYYFNDGY
jgi:hypothetical protein